MSWNLVNKGLELIDGDLCISDNPNTKFMVGANQSRKDSVVKGINKNVKVGSKKRKTKTLINSKVKSGYATYKAKKCEDHTLKNIKILNKFDENFKPTLNVDKVKEYNLKKLSKGRDHDKSKSDLTNISKSVFSEEDFEKMNNEWLALQ